MFDFVLDFIIMLAAAVYVAGFGISVYAHAMRLYEGRPFMAVNSKLTSMPFLAGAPITVVLWKWTDFAGAKAPALALAIVFATVLATWLIWSCVRYPGYRKSKMDALYRRYKALEDGGKHPCIVLFEFEPQVLTSYPSGMDIKVRFRTIDGEEVGIRSVTQGEYDSARGR